MTQGNDWELSKENLQPLKQGRNPGKLEDAVQPATPEKGLIEKQKRQFWEEIEGYDGPDPLENWIRFVKWTQKTFTAGGRQAELLPLLERCTRELQKIEGYKKDVRYLRLWLQYADCLPQPQDVFSFLMENDIGQDFALFYMAYSAFMELRGNFGKAEAIFQKGLDRMAMPIHKLRAKHKDFQERMERRKIRQAQEGCDARAKQVEPQRAVLGVLKGKSRGQQSSGLARPPALSGILGPRSRGSVKSSDKENSVIELDVLTDERFKDDAGPSMPEYNLATGSTSGAWQRLSGFEATRKENERMPSHGKGSRLKQNKAFVPALDPALEIPEDEDLQQAKPQHVEAAKVTLRQRLETLTQHPLEESLMHDPLKLIKTAQAPIGDAPSHANSHVEDKEHEVPLEQGSKHDASDCAGRDSDSDVRHCTTNQLKSTGMDTAKLRTFQAGRTGPLFASKPNNPKRLSDRDGIDTSRLPDVTLNTQAAFDSVNDMFRGALPNDLAWQSNEPTATVRFGDATVTMSTKAAYDAINSMFGGPLGNEAKGKGRPASARSREREDQTGMFEVYEDTSFLERPNTARLGKSEQTASFHPYEDTDFLAKQSGKAAPEQTDSFSIYQDTEFLPQAKKQSNMHALDSRSSFGVSQKGGRKTSTEDDSFFVFEDENL